MNNKTPGNNFLTNMGVRPLNCNKKIAWNNYLLMPLMPNKILSKHHSDQKTVKPLLAHIRVCV